MVKENRRLSEEFNILKKKLDVLQQENELIKKENREIIGKRDKFLDDINESYIQKSRFNGHLLRVCSFSIEKERDNFFFRERFFNSNRNLKFPSKPIKKISHERDKKLQRSQKFEKTLKFETFFDNDNKNFSLGTEKNLGTLRNFGTIPELDKKISDHSKIQEHDNKQTEIELKILRNSVKEKTRVLSKKYTNLLTEIERSLSVNNNLKNFDDELFEKFEPNTFLKVKMSIESKKSPSEELKDFSKDYMGEKHVSSEENNKEVLKDLITTPLLGDRDKSNCLGCFKRLFICFFRKKC